MFHIQIFSANLRAARLREGLSRKEMAQRLGVSVQAVSKWERGEAAPDISNICLLSGLLHISTDELLGVTDAGETALLAVDGGGTKTEFVLLSTDGRLLNRLTLPGSNPNTCKVDGTCEILRRGIDEMLRMRVRVMGICIGGAGMASGGNGPAVEGKLRAAYPNIPVWCDSDICNVLACAQDPDNAIAVICGTGSVVYSTRDGKLLRSGGGGWRLETLGSGYDIGRGAMLAAMEHRDGTGPRTVLTVMVEKKLGASVWDSVQTLYSQPPSFVAEFAPLVIDAWQRGDAVAAQIVQDNAGRLAGLVNIAAGKSPQARQVILGGSLLVKNESFRAYFCSLLEPGLRPDVMIYPQVWGACVRCARLCGVEVPDVGLFIKQYTGEV